MYFTFSELPVQVPDVNLNSVYANNEICLEDIEVYGFDYDYTLATYKQDLHHVLYDLGRDALVTKYKVRHQCYSVNAVSWLTPYAFDRAISKWGVYYASCNSWYENNRRTICHSRLSQLYFEKWLS